MFVVCFGFFQPPVVAQVKAMMKSNDSVETVLHGVSIKDSNTEVVVENLEFAYVDIMRET